MAEDKIFTTGLLIKEKVFGNGGSIIKLSLCLNDSEKGEGFASFVNKHKSNGWLNINVQKSKGGKWYGCLDTFKPNGQSQPPPQQQQQPQQQAQGQQGFYVPPQTQQIPAQPDINGTLEQKASHEAELDGDIPF